MPDWNELEFLSWKEFKQMGPSILQLEATRLEKLMRGAEDDLEAYNTYVKARFELKKFISCLETAKSEKLPESSLTHIRDAISSLSHVRPKSHAPETVDYILDRLNYIFHRSGLVYKN